MGESPQWWLCSLGTSDCVSHRSIHICFHRLILAYKSDFVVCYIFGVRMANQDRSSSACAWVKPSVESKIPGSALAMALEPTRTIAGRALIGCSFITQTWLSVH